MELPHQCWHEMRPSGTGTIGYEDRCGRDFTGESVLSPVPKRTTVCSLYGVALNLADLLGPIPVALTLRSCQSCSALIEVASLLDAVKWLSIHLPAAFFLSRLLLNALFPACRPKKLLKSHVDDAAG